MEWISVETELPSEDEEVLVTDGKLFWTGSYTAGYNYELDKSFKGWVADGEWKEGITHWMKISLPEAATTNVKVKSDKRKADKFDPRDIAILGGDPSL